MKASICVIFLISGAVSGHQVALFLDGLDFCSGTLIWADLVLTTATCVNRSFEVDVVVGAQDLLQPDQIAFVQTRNSFRIAEQFSGKAEIFSQSNLALIEIPPVSNLTALQMPEEDCGTGGLELFGFNLVDGSFGTQQVEVDDGACQEFRACEEDPRRMFCVTVDTSGGDFRNYGSGVTDGGRILCGIVVYIEGNVTCALKILPDNWISSYLDKRED